LEDALSLDELVAIVNAIRKKESRHQRFEAAIQGIDLGDEPGEPGAASFEDVWTNATKADYETEEAELASIGISYGEL
jgi:hypothetical protein